MFASIEINRLLSEWRLRLRRVFAILNPPAWDDEEWRRFSMALAVMVRQHGFNWASDPNVYWDLRWELQGGGHLICQVEHIPGEKTTLIVAQTGGFAREQGSYTWLWAEFDTEGQFSRDLYWVDGTWKEALMTLLMPYQYQATYYLQGPAETPAQLLLADSPQDAAETQDPSAVAAS
jgi:hypothetical protein